MMTRCTFLLAVATLLGSVCDSAEAQGPRGGFQRGGSDGGRGRDGKSDDEMKQRLSDLSRSLKDATESGKITKQGAAEANKLLSFYMQLDGNRDGTIHPDEFANNPYRSTIEKRIRESGLDPSKPVDLNVFISKRLGNAGIKTDQIRVIVDQYAPGRKTTAMKNLESRRPVTHDLPETLVSLDFDGDKQLGLYEWPKNDRQKFAELDLNGDGFITPRELYIDELIRAAAEAAEKSEEERRR